MKRLWTTFLTLGLSLAGAAGAQNTTTLPNGVASGDVTQNSAVLWTRSAALGPVTFEYATDAAFSALAGSVAVEVTDATIPVKALISDLTPGTEYFYRVTDAAGSGATGRFVTPAEVGTRVGLRFGVSGDWRGELAPYVSISNVVERDLAFFVLHGDTIYADIPSPALSKRQAETLEEFRIKHNEVYSEGYGQNYWADVRAATSVLATIDDHEVTNDFAGGAAPGSDRRFGVSDAAFINDTPLYEMGMQVFQEYNPLLDEFYGETGDPRTAGERRLYRYRVWGSDAAVFIIDARSFRDEGLAEPSAMTTEALNAYLEQTFDPTRTLLGQQQFDDLKADLLRAQEAGITWKFIMIPEPAQNLGPVNSDDRYEGYAAERSALLRFIVEHGITNVVFVAADIHGTIINNMTYQDAAGGEHFPTGAFEITTGAVAFDAPFGPTIVNLAAQLGLLTGEQAATFRNFPRPTKELLLSQFINAQIAPFGYDPIGLDESEIDAELLVGAYTATNTFGWTEFEIDAGTQALTVTTYGIDPYTQAELEADPSAVLSRVPQIVSQFAVRPK